MSNYKPNPIHTPLPDSIRYMGKPPPPNVRGQRVKFRFWYDTIIDWMLLNPSAPLTECAKALNRGEGTIRHIVGSDIFKERLAARRTDYNMRLANALVDSSSEVALSSMKEIQKRIADNPAKIPISQLIDINDKIMNRLGYGVAPVAQQTNVNVTNVSVSPAALKEAQQLARRVQEINSTAIEVPAPAKLEGPRDYDDVHPPTISSN